MNETTIEQTLHEKHEKLFICGTGEWARERNINCEQTEILTALIMAKNRDSAVSSPPTRLDFEAIVREHV